MKIYEKRHNHPEGFTLIELLLVIALFSTILILITVNLFRPISKTQASSASSNISSILSQAQNKAMGSDGAGGPTAERHGVHFETDKYVLFVGDTYDSSDTKNFEVSTPDNISLSLSLPCPSPPGDCNNITFEKISGEVVGFDELNSSVCVTETSTNKTFLLKVSFVGVVDAQEGC
jgi:prepilin-type N-terminal cleavage/methylation domain-containing protein